jgi:hypothetical protein
VDERRLDVRSDLAGGAVVVEAGSEGDDIDRVAATWKPTDKGVSEVKGRLPVRTEGPGCIEREHRNCGLALSR